MRTLAGTLLALAFLLPISLLADESTIDLTNRLVSFTDTRGQRFTDIALQRSIASGIVASDHSRIFLLQYTNLSPELLTDWGIPTNRISLALDLAKRRAQEDAFYQAQQAQGVVAARAEAKQFNNYLNVSAKQAQRAAYLQGLKDKVEQARAKVESDKVALEAAKQRYVQQGDQIHIVSGTNQKVAYDTDETRYDAKIDARRQLDADREALLEVEKEFNRASANQHPEP